MQPDHVQRVGLDGSNITVFCVKRVNCLQYNNKIDAEGCYNSCGICNSQWGRDPIGNATLAFQTSLIALFETGRHNKWTTTKTDIRQTLTGRNSQGTAMAPQALLMVRSEAAPPPTAHDQRVLPPGARIATRTNTTTADQPLVHERATIVTAPPQTDMITAHPQTMATATELPQAATTVTVPPQIAGPAATAHPRRGATIIAGHPPRLGARMAQADRPPRQGVRMAQAGHPPRWEVPMVQVDPPPLRDILPPEARDPAPVEAAAMVPLADMAPARKRKRRSAACGFNRDCFSSPRLRLSLSRWLSSASRR